MDAKTDVGIGLRKELQQQKQQKHYTYLSQLQNLARELPVWATVVTFASLWPSCGACLSRVFLCVTSLSYQWMEWQLSFEPGWV